jgi:hypothetical protein
MTGFSLRLLACIGLTDDGILPAISIIIFST